MKNWFCLLLFASPLAHASTTTFYYTGVMYMNFVGSDEVKKSDYLLRRTIDPDKNEIRELITDKPGDAPYGDANIVLKVQGSQYSYGASDIKGVGSLTGDVWKWTNMGGSYIIENAMVSARFVESAILSDPQSIIRHIDIYQSVGDNDTQQLTEQIDIIVHRASQDQYLLSRESLLGHL